MVHWRTARVQNTVHVRGWAGSGTVSGARLPDRAIL
jgi:hypothetical protein